MRSGVVGLVVIASTLAGGGAAGQQGDPEPPSTGAPAPPSTSLPPSSTTDPAPSTTEPAPSTSTSAPTTTLPPPPPPPVPVPDPGAVAAASSTDVAFSDSGDQGGYHIFAAYEREAWAWRPLATIQPDGADGDEWSGTFCVTGDGAHLVAVVAPRHALNQPVVRDRGGLAYVVDTSTGEVRPLVAGVALKYHTPGCGTGDQVALVRHLGADQERTAILVGSASRATISSETELEGQLTSPVPVSGNEIVAARDLGIVRVTPNGKERVVAQPGGQPYMLRAAQDGVDFLVDDLSGTARVKRLEKNDELRELGSGPLATLGLYQGRDGLNAVVGASAIEPGAPVRVVAAPGEFPDLVNRTSVEGHAVVSDTPGLPPKEGATPIPASEAGTAAHVFNATPPRPRLTNASDGTAIAAPGPTEYAEPATDVPEVQAGGPGASASKVEGTTNLVARGPGTPACAVPRNHLRRQVPQPSPAQVNWAIQQADRNLLTGANARPANFLNMQLNAYSPSSDFARPPLSGYPSATVPPSVIQAVYAQESNWKQASWHALPGLAGNPLIADYYGSGGTLDVIDYGSADCGYGVSQRTDGMRADSGQLSANGKTKVAVDYAENVAAGLRKLVEKWNETWGPGWLLNGGDPQYLENWYFAIWAYNSGINPNDGAGNYGLGWTNNPMNADYPPSRQPFLRTTYADAATPWLWPYQEKVLGWMETPLLDGNGDPSYAEPSSSNSGLLSIPPRWTFCTSANHCDPNYLNGSLSYCTLANRHCWWHWAVNFASCPADCATSSFTVSTGATEPSATNPYPPACGINLPPPSGSGPLTIVDDDPQGLSVVGCSPPSNFTPQGTFDVQMGGLGVIDWHQLGSGLMGHSYFTHNRTAGDTAHHIVGTWTPPTSVTGLTSILAHVPESGSTTAAARYEIHDGLGGVTTVQVDQHLHADTWVGLGTYSLSSGAKVVLSNVTGDASIGNVDVAFDAMAFSPTQGTIVTKKVDSALVFDHNQNLDTDFNPDLIETIPITMQAMYDWANGITSGVTSLPTCSGPPNNTCVSAQTKAAFQTWRDRVLAAGTTTKPEPLGGSTDTQGKLYGYSNNDPPATLSDGWLNDLNNFKYRSQTVIQFVHSGGAIDPNSVSMRTDFVTGHSHLPAFVTDIMQAYDADYGISVPNISYQAKDLTRFSHTTSAVNPLSGTMPARAYKPYARSTINGNCVTVQSVGGGGIAYKQMVLNDAVRGAVDSWVIGVQSAVGAGEAPAALGVAADEVRKLYFKAANVAYPTLPGPKYDGNSPYWAAGGIWVEQDFDVCSNGAVNARAGTPGIAGSGYMPDLYVWIDNNPVTLTGAPWTPTGRGVVTGDWVNFAHGIIGYPDILNDSPWVSCNWGDADYRNGQPWDLWFYSADDETPQRVRLCADSLEAWQEE